MSASGGRPSGNNRPKSSVSLDREAGKTAIGWAPPNFSPFSSTSPSVRLVERVGEPGVEGVHSLVVFEQLRVRADGPGKIQDQARLVSRQRLLRVSSSCGTTYANERLALLTSPQGVAALDLSRESAATREAYGQTSFGQSCLLGRRLVEAGVPYVQVNWSRYVEVYYTFSDYGWDTHADNFGLLAEWHGPLFDRVFSTLLDDLERAQGCWRQRWWSAWANLGGPRGSTKSARATTGTRSPDGRKFAFGSSRNRDFKTSVMNADGSDVVPLTLSLRLDAPRLVSGWNEDRLHEQPGRKLRDLCDERRWFKSA